MTVEEKYNVIDGDMIIRQIVNEILSGKNPSLLISRTDYLCNRFESLQHGVCTCNLSKPSD